MATTHPLALSVLRRLGHQDWIRFGVRDRILRRFCSPDTVGHHDFEVDYFGLKYRGRLDSYLDWQVYFYGAYEKYELRVLRDLIRRAAHPIFVDVGANVGLHSLFMSQYCAAIHAFEPFEPLANCLKGHIRYNHIANITVHNVALGSRDAELAYFAPRGANQGTGSFLPSHAKDNNEYVGRLPVVHADRYIEALRLDRLDLIKIDVEGFERDVLRGLRQTLKRFRPVVLMEVSKETRTAFSNGGDVVRLLPAGYTIRDVETYKTCCFIFGAPSYRYLDFDLDIPCSNVVIGPCERLHPAAT